MARFFHLTPDVSVQYWLEFLGFNAVLVKDMQWPERHFASKNPNRKSALGILLDETARFYLQAKDFQNGLLFEPFATELFDFAKLQFKRENGARIVHYRPSDETPFLGGFGRVNPRNEKACHKDFSETFVDRKPGTIFTKYQGNMPVGEEVWRGFDPVYLKVKPADGRDEYFLKVWTKWGDDDILVMSAVNPPDVPKELQDCVFRSFLSERNLDSDSRLDEVAKSALRW